MKTAGVVLVVGGVVIVGGVAYLLFARPRAPLPAANPNSHGSATKAGGGHTGSDLTSQLLGLFTAGANAYGSYENAKASSQQETTDYLSNIPTSNGLGG